MRRDIRFKLLGERADIALKFANDLNMGLNEAAERALFWAIRQAYQPVKPQSPGFVPRPDDQDGVDVPHGDLQANTAGDSPEAPTASDSAPLANSSSVDG